MTTLGEMAIEKHLAVVWPGNTHLPDSTHSQAAVSLEGEEKKKEERQGSTSTSTLGDCGQSKASSSQHQALPQIVSQRQKTAAAATTEQCARWLHILSDDADCCHRVIRDTADDDDCKLQN